jgi:hypothetical protein
MIRLSSVLVLVFAVSHLSASEIIQEFTKVEAYYSFEHNGEPNPKQMLEKNIMEALKIAITRHLPNGKEKAKSIQTDSFDYETLFDEKIVVAKFEDSYFEFRFGSDPTRFFQSPISHKHYKKPANWESTKQKLEN